MNRYSPLMMVFIIVAVLTSSWFTFLEVHKHGIEESSADVAHTMDFYMRGVDYVQLDANGQLLNRLKTPDLVHYPNEDTYVFKNPEVDLLDENMIPWHITAAAGQSKNGISIVDFSGGVAIKHETTPGSGHFLEINSPAITYYPKEHYADSKELVIIAEPGSIVHSIGARVDFLTKGIHLLSQIQGQYVPGDKESGSTPKI